MKQTINHVSQFRNAFSNAGRNDQFSYEGLNLLFDYLEEVNPDYELDVIELCCEYTEDHPEDIAESYSIDIEGLDEGDMVETVIDFLERHSSIVGTTASGSIVYASNF